MNCSQQRKSTGRILSGILPVVACGLLVIFPSRTSSQQPQPSSKQPVQQQKSVEEERLMILRADIQREIENYKKLKRELEESRKVLDEKTKEKLSQLAKMYEYMPSEDAARKLERLDEETAVMILTALKPKTAGKILAQMESERAASLSKKILAKGPVFPEKTSP
ncbi:MAG: hypothetical protein K8I29_09045 [Alphaproteobacteria bacterium]|uniref:Magnesium transporter MgtE intracellular domain-containing protein n=1 Tax=Candidatus Nitrobium versatile TaxID=2884831 RepID=A0A953J622_9BACT|nr:hypothetical protein [Candidatus Nitrobium versatile]